MAGIQQAFLPQRDIADANIAAQESYYRAAERAKTKLWILLDCTGGYSNMSWAWIRSTLLAARIPEGLFRAVMRIVECHSEAVFVFDRFACSPVALGTGLAQGCPFELHILYFSCGWYAGIRI